MTSPTPLLDLASSISAHAATVSTYLTQSGHAQPSFAASGPARFPADAPQDVQAARAELVHAARQLQFLALGPTEALQWFALTGALDTATLRWLYHFGVPEAVSIEGSISFADLARSLDVSERILTRILRHAMLNNIFCEPSVGHVAHSSLSLQLARPGNAIRGVVGHQTETVFPAVAHMVDAHDKYGTREENVTRTPFNEAFGTDQGALQWVADDPVRSARFAESMKGGASSGPFSAVHTVRGFDWDALGEGTVVDVGGSAGQLSKAIAASAPRLHFIVQDQASMIAKGRVELEPEYEGRIDFQVHDFFKEEPVAEPDVFLLRLILHDWPDADAVTILKQLMPKMGPKTRIIINDAVMPQSGTTHPLHEKHIRNIDMMMLSMFNGLERTKKDWEDLIARTELGLVLTSITKPPGAALSVLEVMKR